MSVKHRAAIKLNLELLALICLCSKIISNHLELGLSLLELALAFFCEFGYRFLVLRYELGLGFFGSVFNVISFLNKVCFLLLHLLHEIIELLLFLLHGNLHLLRSLLLQLLELLLGLRLQGLLLLYDLLLEVLDLLLVLLADIGHFVVLGLGELGE